MYQADTRQNSSQKSTQKAGAQKTGIGSAASSTDEPITPVHLSQKLKQSTCAYCGVGCGVDVAMDLAEDVPQSLAGTPEHPANFGRLCVKGTHLLDTLKPTNQSDEQRLGHPFIGEQQVAWQEATDHVAQQLTRIIAEHGKGSVAMYVSGQLLTEDYYVANKLMKGYIGTANIDTNSRLCMASAVAGYKRAFGEDVVPCDYQDLEHTELLVLVGSNAAWTHPVLFQRMERAKQLNPAMKVVVIDPRTTATAALADLSLTIKPGADVALFNGLLRYLHTTESLDPTFIDAHTEGFEATLDSVRPWTLDMVADYCDLAVKDIQQFYEWFAASESAVTFYSMGVNQSSSGTDKCNAIINVHLASGKMLRKGNGPFSITGQPNAMGGREVGGLANQLAAHMDVENPQHQSLVQRFWQSPTIATEAGLKAVDLFKAIEQGDVKAVWIMATNPLVSVPNREQVLRALKKCELVIVSDCVNDAETLQLADVKLPATGWAEKDGIVTNSERRISRQRAFMPPFEEAKHDWRIICDVAQKMGFSGFDFQHQAEIFDEYVRMTGFENQGARQLDLSPLAGLSQKQYQHLSPLQWPMDQNRQPIPVFADKRFTTASGKAQFVTVTPHAPQQQTSDALPFVMNSGRLRDHWHTMTRTGRAATLNGHIRKPQISLHPMDAHRLGVQQGDIIQAQSQDDIGGKVLGYADLSDDLQRGHCFMPIHWNQQFSSHANVSNIYSSAVDPISGQPECKHGAVALTKAPFAQQWVVFCGSDRVVRQHLAEQTQASQDFWVMSTSQHCQIIYGASDAQHSNFIERVKQLSRLGSANHSQSQQEWLVTQQQQYQAVIGIQAGEIQMAAFAWRVDNDSTAPIIPEDWLDTIFAQKKLDLAGVQSLLRLQPSEDFRQGKQICSCFQVREKTILDAIAEGANSVQALGDTLKCGTNCGSCRSELQQLITAHNRTSAAIPVVQLSSNHDAAFAN